MTSRQTQNVIHIFAAMHLAVSMLFRAMSISDTIVLTLLTVAMVLIICHSRRVSLEFTAASVIFVNGFGYLFGNLGAELVKAFITWEPLVNPLSTFFTTEIIGWTMLAMLKLFMQDAHGQDSWRWDSRMTWLLAAVAAIIAARFVLSFIFSSSLFQTPDIYSAIGLIFSNAWAVISLIFLDLLLIRWSRSLLKKGLRSRAVAAVICGVAGGTLLVALISRYGFPFEIGLKEPRISFLQLFIIALLANIVVYSLIFMMDYAINSRRRMNEEMDKAHYEQYRYLRLKQQMNPHFLFNSLNILDCMVMDGENEQASVYIRKLAGIYRYMIKSEEEPMVPLGAEMDFVDSYVDLLQVRFGQGFRVDKAVAEADLGRYVIPCSIQLLIENAIKHNSVSPSNPLIISISSDGAHVKVGNMLIPKVSEQDSTHLGQKYIRQQYQDVAGLNIEVQQADGQYIVSLPLIDKI